MCLTPITLYKSYADMDGTKTSVVPCGKCHKCRRDKQNAWVFRLTQEQKHSETSCFLTLTYAEPDMTFNGHETLNPKHLQDFWKKLRKLCPSTTYIKKNGSTGKKSNLKYFAVGEYGTKFMRPHYHAIVYNIPATLLASGIQLQNLWGHGSIDIAQAEGGSMRYTIGYIMHDTFTPTQDDDDRYPTFKRQSQGLGKEYLTPQMVNYHLQLELPIITQPGGQILKMPRYFKEKIFSKIERKKMAETYQELNKLDLNQYLDYDYTKEVDQKKDSIRRHNKQQKQNKKHSF